MKAAFGGNMFRLKLLAILLVLAVFWCYEPVFAQTQSSSASDSKEGASAALIDSTLPATALEVLYDEEGNTIYRECSSCPPQYKPEFNPFSSQATVHICFGETVYDTLIVTDLNTDQVITVTKTAGIGNFNSTPTVSPVYGYLSFVPDTSGTYVVTFKATDDMGYTTYATKSYYVYLNYPPEITNGGVVISSETISSELTYDVEAADIEEDPITYSLVSGPGTIDPETGLISFTPPEAGTFQFTVEASDECGSDLTVITFEISSVPVELVCPEPYIQEFICEPGSLCYPISGIPEGAEVTVLPASAWWDAEAGKVCFYTNCSVEKHLTAIITYPDDPENADTCQFTVDVTLNSPPLVILPGDEAFDFCVPEEICFPVGINDPNGNIASIEVLPQGAVYDDIAGTVCFTPTESGIYQIIVTALDECEAIDADTLTATVNIDEPPVVNAGEDFAVELCTLSEFCFPVSITGDNITEIGVSPQGYFDAESNQICFTPDSEGTFEIVLYATNNCDPTGADTVNVTVSLGTTVEIDCPVEPLYRQLCGPDEICIDLPVAPLNAVVRTSFGTYENGTICFVADTAGTYTITLSAQTECGSDECTIVVNVDILEVPIVSCPFDPMNFVICAGEQVCVTPEFSPVDASIQITGSGATYENGQICFTPESEGSYGVQLIASNECFADTCNYIFDIDFTNPVEIFCPQEPFSQFLCEPAQLCMPIEIANLAGDVTVSYGEFIDGQLCFFADTAGAYEIELTASGSCGSQDQCTIIYNVEFGQTPHIDCPAEPFSYLICEPTQFCIDLDIAPSGATITPSYGEYIEGQLCFVADTAGTYTINITAESDCGTAECTVTAVVEQGDFPEISCPVEPINEFLCEPGQICYELGITPLDAEISTSFGSYSNGQLCFMADTAGTYNIEITADTECGTVDCTISFMIEFGTTPVVECPQEPFSFDLCEAGQICVPLNITGADNISPSLGTFADGQLCFVADTSGTYEINISAASECGTDDCTIFVNVTIDEAPAIECPIEPIAFDLCQPEEICIPIIFAPASAEIRASFGTIADGSLCFVADTSGTYIIDLTASNNCGTDDCRIIAQVEIGTAPVIECPLEPNAFDLCGSEEICIPLAITGAANVETSLGSYADGQICFVPDTSGTYTITVTGSNECGTNDCTIIANVNIDEVPAIVCPESQGIDVCDPQEICVPITYSPSTASISASYGTIVDGSLCFMADTTGRYEIVVTVSNNCGEASCLVRVNVTVSAPATIDCPTEPLTFQICEPSELCFELPIVAPYGHVVISYGHMDDGQLCFQADTAGTYTIEVHAQNNCGAADCIITAIVEMDEAPIIACPQESFEYTLCEPGEYCIDLAITPANGLIETSYGTYSNGQLCFLADTAGTYEIAVTATTNCGTAECTIFVNMLPGQIPNVTCPQDMTEFICEPENICVPVEGIPSGATVTVFPPSAWFDAETSSICFYTNCSVEKNLSFTVATECGEQTCSFVVDVTMNSRPLVILGPDMSVAVCGNESICVPAGINDVNDNIAIIEVLPIGIYNAIAGNICFVPDTAGVYTLILRAVDECAMLDADTVSVTVDFNDAPVVTSADDYDILLCDVTEVCFPVDISDDEGNLESVNIGPIGSYDTGTGNVCFTADTAGVYQIIIGAIDACGLNDADTTNVTVTFGETAQITCPIDPVNYFTCEPGEVCFDIPIAPADASVEVSFGSYSDGQLCFQADTSGMYEIHIAASSDCGSDECTVLFEVVIGESPVISCPTEPIVRTICEPQQICYELSITPLDAEVSASFGTYTDGSLCFVADTTGTYEIEVTAETACGIESCTIIFNVELGEAPAVVCPEESTQFLCGPGEVCREVSISPPDAEIGVYPIGSFQDGQVCFTADTAGIYEITVTAVTACGENSCSFTVNVEFNSAPTVDAGDDAEYFQCIFENICQPIYIADLENNIMNVSVSHGTFNFETSELCFIPDTVGTYCIEVTAADACGAEASDIVCITVTSGEAAQIDCPASPFARMLCEAGQVCVPLGVTPASAEVTVNYGTYAAGQLCFQADTAGTYKINVSASDACGDDECLVTVNVTFGAVAEITCPDLPIAVSLCEPGNVSVTLPITPSNATVTVSPIGAYNASTGKLNFFADTTGTYRLTVNASAPCGTDQCVVEIDVTIEESPTLSCPGVIDTLLCVGSTDELCFEIELTGTNAEVTVSPQGYYSAGEVCVPVTSAGSTTYKIIARNFCAADTCEVTVNISDNQPPVLTVPDEILIPSCNDEFTEVCIGGIFATDPEEDELTFELTCGPGTLFMVRPDSGKVCFTPTSSNMTYQFCVVVSDGCSSVMQTFNVTVYPSNVCETCIEASIVTDTCYIVGSIVPVRVMVTAEQQIGGFDLLISYDASVMTFLSAYQGDAIPDWEYFTYNIESSTCGGGCPSGIVRLVGIADRANGANHPPVEQLTPDGELVIINMRLTSDQNVGGLYLPINFFWLDCGDNGFSDPTGNNLYVDGIIYGPFGSVIWDEADEDRFPESNRIDYTGTPDICLAGDKITPIRCVEFHNGGICVIHPDEIDDRGDLNLNGVSYEIADAVVFTNYFLYGFSAFLISVPGQTAASDVNADGVPLTVADLVYLVRVITGDATPHSKVAPNGSLVRLVAEPNKDKLTISAEINYPVGAGLLIFEYEGVTPSIPELGALPDDMNLAYSIDGNSVKVLLYSFSKNIKINPGQGSLINIPISGDGNIRLTSAVFASYSAEELPTEIVSKLLPSQFSLSQNYPNPFNPSTSVDLTVPAACHWNMSIINMNGQIVKHYEGDAEPGVTTIVWDGTGFDGRTVATGIYLYKIEAGTFTDTKKMIMLK